MYLQIEKLETQKLFMNFSGLAIQQNSFTVQPAIEYRTTVAHGLQL